MPDEIQGKNVDITSLFTACGIEISPVSIVETSGMYPFKNKIEDNWAYFTTAGLQVLSETLAREGKVIKDVGIVGICSGVEAIAVLHIFQKNLQRVVVTDIDDEILKGTMYNLKKFLGEALVQIVPAVGSFCEPIKKLRIKVDLVHANIPNLPASGTEDLSLGAEKGTFLPAQLYEGYNPPEKFVGWALGSQYAYLQSAKEVTKDGGTIITELGGRVPLPLVQELFDSVGLKLEEIVSGFKEQTEALIDFTGYHRLEEKYGTEFEFYLYNESKDLLNKQGIKNPSADISAQDLKNLLEPFKISAGRALELWPQKIPVGHTVHLFRGVK
ncbi:MAG: hypothetical protein V1664_05470 [Candidatus Uhrbacteria bacterium]